jgi:hypothetical protein
VKAVEQASAENLLGGFVIVGGNEGFDILLPVFGLQPRHCDMKQKEGRGRWLDEEERRNGEGKGWEDNTNRGREGGEKLLVDGGGLVDGEQLKSIGLD